MIYNTEICDAKLQTTWIKKNLSQVCIHHNSILQTSIKKAIFTTDTLYGFSRKTKPAHVSIISSLQIKHVEHLS
jgi:N-acetylglutamate synthase/N-acetylornithine aminotransferase